MLIIRFSRVGKKSHAQYKVVLAEKTYPVQGKFVEILGSYDPHQKKAVLKEERIKYWIAQGAQCSDTAYNLLVKNGLVTGQKRKVKVPAKPVEASTEAAPTNEAEKVETPVEAVKEEVKAETGNPAEVK